MPLKAKKATLKTSIFKIKQEKLRVDIRVDLLHSTIKMQWNEE